jgi:hypothetical protein
MHRQPLFALPAKIQVQQTVNTVDPFVIPRVSPPLQNLKKFRKPYRGYRLATACNATITGSSHVVRPVMVNRSAQVQTPAGLTDNESEHRYQMIDQLTLTGWF